MQASIVARNYAETLLALAQRNGGAQAVEEFGRAADAVAEILEREPRVRAFFDAPGISQEQKKDALRASFDGRVPPLFLRFLFVVVDKRRERLLREIAAAYHDLVDKLLGRVRADITLAEPADELLQRELQTWLERRLGKTVIPRFRVDRELLGGVIIQVEDEVLDGSVRHRLSELRRRLMNVRIPQPAGV